MTVVEELIEFLEFHEVLKEDKIHLIDRIKEVYLEKEKRQTEIAEEKAYNLGKEHTIYTNIKYY